MALATMVSITIKGKPLATYAWSAPLEGVDQSPKVPTVINEPKTISRSPVERLSLALEESQPALATKDPTHTVIG